MHSRKDHGQKSLPFLARLRLGATKRESLAHLFAVSPLPRAGAGQGMRKRGAGAGRQLSDFHSSLLRRASLCAGLGTLTRLFVLSLLSVFLMALSILPARAQSAKLQLGALEQLASKAQEVTTVTLDQQLLQLALNFMSKDDEARSLLQQLKGVYIRSYEFNKEGEYSRADVDSILTQLRAEPWRKIVSDRDLKTNETDEIYIMSNGNAIRGLAIISAEPKELTVVNIVGAIDLRKLSELEGHFGVPHLKLNQKKEGQAN